MHHRRLHPGKVSGASTPRHFSRRVAKDGLNYLPREAGLESVCYKLLSKSRTGAAAHRQELKGRVHGGDGAGA